MTLLPPLILELRAKAGEVHSELKKVGTEVEEMDRKVQGGMSKSSKAFSGLASAGKAVTFGLAGAGIAVASFGVEASLAGQAADAKLRVAIKNVGGDFEKMDPQIKSTDDRMRALGFTNAETENSLASLTTSLGSPQKALADMGLAADLARMKNIPLAQSALLVAKAAEGQTRPLKALGIDLPVYAGGAQNVKLANMALAKAQQNVNDILTKTPGAVSPASKAHGAYEKALRAVQAAHLKLASVQHSGQTIMAALTARVKGNAEAFGKTLPGQIAQAKAQLDNIGEKVGGFVIPKLEMLMKAVSGVIAWFGRHTTAAKVLGGVIVGVLAVAIGAYITKLAIAAAQSIASYGRMIGTATVWAVTQARQLAESAAGMAAWAVEHAVMAGSFIAENVAMAASATAAYIAENAATLGLVAAIGAVVAAVIWLATHWQTAWNAIKAVLSAVYNSVIKPTFGFIKDVFKTVVTAVSTGLGAIASVWHSVWNGAKTIYNSVIAPVFGFVKDHWKLVVDLLTGGLGLIATHWNSIWNGIKSVYNSVIAPVFSAIGSAVTGAWNTITSVGAKIARTWSALWGGLKSTVTGVVSDIGSIVSGIWGGVTSGLRSVINGGISIINDAISGINGLIDVANEIPFVNIPHISSIPYMAQGGTVLPRPGGTLAILGEAGRAESVVDTGLLNRQLSASLDLLGSGRLAVGSGAGMGGNNATGGGRQVIELHTHLLLDGREIHEAVQEADLQTGLRRGLSYQNYKR